MQTALDGFGLVRSGVQRQLHSAFLNAVCPFIYKEAMAQNSDRILAENGWQDFRLQTMAMTPRRFGKTTSVSMFAAACCLLIPNMEIVIFSTGRRASKLLLDQILAMIQKYKDLNGCDVNDASATVIKSNQVGCGARVRHRRLSDPVMQETVWLRGRGGDDVRKCSSFPGRAAS